MSDFRNAFEKALVSGETLIFIRFQTNEEPYLEVSNVQKY